MQRKQSSAFNVPINQKQLARAFGNNPPTQKFSCVLEMIQSSERAPQEDHLQQQELMLQMLNKNQQMMMDILSLLSRDNTGGSECNCTKPDDIDKNVYSLNQTN